MQQAQQIIGKRTPAEIAHDDEVVAGLEMGLPIEAVLANAAQKHPSEALQWDHNSISDIASHYSYLKEHARILKMMQSKKPR
ncbi:MAG: hypothetical protein K9I59_06790 [Chlorobium sp.]|uniref:hypothetical protein n=1 Tax=Chlorobium sp. TaxID=1095 RepID=UPI001DCDD3C0|nr:hypothetical protein [Chlorobium sp.]MBN1279926.1 hypothetical protein [Chlorobiaceae bacterium]MCF8216479.1 hypothetical protein [Chlorobium sp.]MCF8271355.1 hypothetical protein [Chlorobium sp.]MCF8287756.1 hypothetical protein [Chlorobium sp.]MCF8291266.1 hypothetical protein [Chlorobium sp.]